MMQVHVGAPLVAAMLLAAARSAGGSNTACIDDSDCVSLGYKHACFLYYCHNWMEATKEHPHCEVDWHCKIGSQCYRHRNLRRVSHGVCFTDYEVGVCNTHEDCNKGDFCCGMYCCPHNFFMQWQNFTCLSDLQCRSWRTGSYCCQDGRCCDEMPPERAATTSRRPISEHHHDEYDEDNLPLYPDDPYDDLDLQTNAIDVGLASEHGNHGFHSEHVAEAGDDHLLDLGGAHDDHIIVIGDQGSYFHRDMANSSTEVESISSEGSADDEHSSKVLHNPIDGDKNALPNDSDVISDDSQPADDMTRSQEVPIEAKEEIADTYYYDDDDNDTNDDDDADDEGEQNNTLEDENVVVEEAVADHDVTMEDAELNQVVLDEPLEDLEAEIQSGGGEASGFEELNELEQQPADEQQGHGDHHEQHGHDEQHGSYHDHVLQAADHSDYDEDSSSSAWGEGSAIESGEGPSSAAMVTDDDVIHQSQSADTDFTSKGNLGHHRGGRWNSDNDNKLVHDDIHMNTTEPETDRAKAATESIQHGGGVAVVVVEGESRHDTEEQHHRHRHHNSRQHNSSGAEVGPPSAPGVSRPPESDAKKGRRRPEKALPVAFSRAGGGGGGNIPAAAAVVMAAVGCRVLNALGV